MAKTLYQYIIKSEEKKTAHTFCLITRKGSTLDKNLFSKGQIDLFRGLKWGIVRLCSSNITGDTIKNHKNWFFKKHEFLHFFSK